MDLFIGDLAGFALELEEGGDDRVTRERRS
jgi:hypothetical protein